MTQAPFPPVLGQVKKDTVMNQTAKANESICECLMISSHLIISMHHFETYTLSLFSTQLSKS